MHTNIFPISKIMFIVLFIPAIKREDKMLVVSRVVMFLSEFSIEVNELN